jgi:hypothetical protein
MYQIFMVILLGVSLSGCVKISDIEGSPEADAVKVANSPGVSVTALPEPNHYQVHLPAAGEATIFRRSSVGTGAIDSFEFIPMTLLGDLFIDSSVVAGRGYIYQLGKMRDLKFEVVSEYQVQVPEDLVIEGSVVLGAHTQWTTYHRIFLEPGSVLTSMGFDLQVKATELIARGGLIQSFPENLKALQGLRGRSGGSLNLEFDSAQGELAIFLRGENGGDGGAGEAFEAGKIHSQSCYSGTDFNPDGDFGRNGQDGGMGGSSGKLKLFIKQNHDFVPHVFKQPGLGGAGGRGGPGQKGGLRGIQSSSKFGTKCEVIQQGKDGPDGMPGAHGPSGIYESFCFKDPTIENCD